MDLERAEKPRPRQELVVRAIRPVADRAIARLARLGVDPVQVVLAHGALGLGAAAAIAHGATISLWIAAIAILGKVVLDNIDGGLARATGRVTLTGRYLDTIVDFTVNAALFGALATHGPPWLAATAFVVLTAVLSFDYNSERLYRAVRAGERGPDPAGRPPAHADHDATPIGASEGTYNVLRTIYRRLFAPQDRAVEALDRWAFARVYGAPPAAADRASRLAWNDLFSTAALADLGLSTQMTALAALLVAGAPFAWVWLVLAETAYVVCVWLLRAWRFRAYLRTR